MDHHDRDKVLIIFDFNCAQGVCGTKQISKKVYEVASGNHEMYIRRRRPDTLEVVTFPWKQVLWAGV